MNFYRLKKNLWMLPAFLGGILFVSPDIAMRIGVGLSSWHIRGIQALAVLLFMSSAYMFIKDWGRHRRFHKSTTENAVRNMTWQQFEKLISDLFAHDGYRVEERGGNHADGGIDLIARKGNRRVLIQCKHWKKNSVGAPVVREIYGIMVSEKFDQACIATCGKFTKESWAFVKGKPMRLLDGRRLSEAIAHRVHGK